MKPHMDTVASADGFTDDGTYWELNLEKWNMGNRDAFYLSYRTTPVGEDSFYSYASDSEAVARERFNKEKDRILSDINQTHLNFS